MNGSRLRQWRTDAGLSTRAFAERVGSTSATISRLETGAQTPSMALASRIAEFTKGAVTANDFMATPTPADAAE